MRLLLSFGLFGLYIGLLCGLSTSPLAMSLMPLLFTFAGGSIFMFFGQLKGISRNSAISAIGATSFGAIVGTLGAITIASHSLLGPKPKLEGGGYLRSAQFEKIEATLVLLEKGAITSSEAVKQIRDVSKDGH